MLGGRREGDRPDARGDATTYAVEGRRVVADALDDEVGDPLGSGLVGVGEHDGELVAAHPRHDVGGADRAAQQSRDRDEELVAGVVPERVVDLLEVVEVEQQQGAGRTVPAAPVEVALELALEAAPVGQPGEHVVVGEVGEPVEVAAAVGDVDDVDHHDVADLRVLDDGAAERHGDVVATGVTQAALGVHDLAAVGHQPLDVVRDGVLAGRLEALEGVPDHVRRLEADDHGQGGVDAHDRARRGRAGRRRAGRCRRGAPPARSPSGHGGSPGRGRARSAGRRGRARARPCSTPRPGASRPRRTPARR